MSPTLFVIAMEFFSRMLNKAYMDRKVGFYSSKSSMKVTHLMYADDLLIFANGEKRSICNLSKVLEDFCKISGLSINKQKSNMYLSKNIDRGRAKKLMEYINFKLGNLPFKYLGTYIFKGRVKCNYFSYLEEAIKSKLSGWMKAFVSMAGRATLIQSVLNSIALHTMAVMPIPQKVIKRLQGMISNFLWDKGKEKRRHWVSWKIISKPREEGGLGIRSVKDAQKILLAKLAWKFVTNASPWMNFIRNKKSREGSNFNSFIWKSIKPVVIRHRRESRWCIGKGDTKLGHFSEWFSDHVPNEVRQVPIREIQGNTTMMAKVPPVLQDIIAIMQFSEEEDRVIWKISKTGIFTNKKYSQHCRTSGVEIPEFVNVWQKWLPPKFSIFMWRVLHSSLPTDDKISTLGIQIVSRCWCCANPSIESMEHLFFHSDEANRLWMKVSAPLNMIIPNCLNQFISKWLIPMKGDDFYSNFVGGIGILCMWVLWRFRNSARMDDKKIDCWKNVLIWVWKIAHHIPGTRNAYANICNFFKVSHGHVNNIVSNPSHWRPNPWGKTMNCSINIKHGSFYCGIITRNHLGDFVHSACFSVGDVDMLLPAIELSFRKWPHLIQHLTSIQSSHDDMTYLANDEAPWENLRLWRKFKCLFPNLRLKHISSSENNTAIAMSYLGKDISFDSAADLPVTIMNAFIFDRRQLCRANRR